MRCNRTEITITVFFPKVLFKKEQFIQGFQCKDNGVKYIKGEMQYEVTLRQDELSLEKIIRERDKGVLTKKIQDIIDKWSIAWNKCHFQESTINQIKKQNKELDEILISALTNKNKVNFQDLKAVKPFESIELFQQLNSKLQSYKYEKIPDTKVCPQAPVKESKKYSAWERLTGKAKHLELEKELKFLKEKSEWETVCGSILEQNNQTLKLHLKQISEIDEERKQCENEIEVQRQIYYATTRKIEEKFDALENLYLSKDPNAVEEYCKLVLNASKYPTMFPKQSELQYIPQTSTLIIDLLLPTPDEVSKEKDAIYNAYKNEVKFIYMSTKEFNSRYDRLIYSAILRTVHEIYDADVICSINSITVNGYVDILSKATGKKELKYIATISVLKEQFINIDLEKVDPSQCFKSLKGISARELINLTPIAPIIKISRLDSRFIDGKNILQDIDLSSNLAVMDWEDFEHLIRELFHKEFQVNGGEVKITQSSRDGGVDAIAFDPDPIRGGKIIIQAKRYNNVVGVSAVRDLYGSILNEGASKGIIVTTSYFGNDAYEFAKNKPISLLNGENLLYLLNKHGYNAQIKLQP